MGDFNNFNSVVGSQTLINNSGKEIETNKIQTLLNEILLRVSSLNETGASKTDIDKVLMAVAEMKVELGRAKPRVAALERSLEVVGNVASVVSLVDQIRPFLRGIL